MDTLIKNITEKLGLMTINDKNENNIITENKNSEKKYRINIDKQIDKQNFIDINGVNFII